MMTDEEQAKDLTGERFEDWMCIVGEDYVDQCSIPQEDFMNFCLFVINKKPDYKKRIEKIMNEGYAEPLMIEGVYEEEDEGNGYKKFYEDYAEFLNTIPELKAQTNANLILVTEHYGK
jgi:hypothetical protein